MAGGLERIKPIELTRLVKRPGLHADGRGLYLKVAPTGSASWILRYMLNGKAHTMGLGSYPEITLRQARDRALDARRLKASGVDPISKRRAEKAEQAAKSNPVTFEIAANAFIESRKSGWKDGGKTGAQWSASFRDWVHPFIGSKPIDAIGIQDILAILTQDVAPKGKSPARFWDAKSETASRCRYRIENVLDYAKAAGFREGDNPAAWKTLKFTLPKRSDVAAVQHHGSLPYIELPEFMATLRSRANTSRLALEFTILTAARTTEAIESTWSEIDLDKAVWKIPPERMKTKSEHNVPLSPQAVELLKSLRKGKGHELVFPGMKPGEPISNNTMRKLLQTITSDKVTPHGFRATFSTWVREKTNFAPELAEVSLSHTVGSAVERAYARTEFFDKRRKLMDAWARYTHSAIPAID